MKSAKELFFIALIPPLEVAQIAHQIKQEFANKFANKYNSKAALKSPPHITLKPPFHWHRERLTELKFFLDEFSKTYGSIPIILDDFGAFVPRVIYLNVVKTPELLTVQQNLIAQLASSFSIIDRTRKNHVFTPHLTVGFKDLTQDNFDRAWSHFQQQKLYFEFSISQLTLLAHRDKKWLVISQH